MSPVVEMAAMEMAMVMSPVMERMSCAGLCKHCAGGVQGKSELQAPLNKEVRLLCHAVSGNFITTRVRERRNIFVELTMACVMTLPDTPIVSKAVGQNENVPSKAQSSKNDDKEVAD